MERTEGGRKKPSGAVAEFFRQTFRRHSGDEYSELLTRGMRGDGGVNKKYPWAYIRLFALFTVLFAVFLLIVRFTSNELFIPTIVAIGSAGFSLTILIFIYELYPKKDLSIMLVLLAMLMGGAAANVFAQILFSLFPTANEWLFSVLVGFFEELPKAVASILIIVLLRKNSPLAGFVIGAAVGCGFSIVEDMGYIFMQANELPMMNLTTVIEVAVSRGITALCTHILWTAAIGWAYCYFNRHLANILFYVITLFSCGLHICWDLPLEPLPMTLVYVCCGSIAGVECILILHFERKRALSPAGVPVQLEMPLSDDGGEQTLDKTDPDYWKYWGRFTMALGAFIMAVIAIIYCAIPFRESYSTQTFYSSESFIAYMQEGRKFTYTENRPYDLEGGGEIIAVDKICQYENINNVKVQYIYTFSKDSYDGNTYYLPYAVCIIDETAEGVKTYTLENVYNKGKLYASFFRVRENVTGFNFKTDGDVTVFTYNADFERDLTAPRYMGLFGTFAGIFGISVICFISLSIKSWRVKKLCSTKNASSVK